MKLKLETIKISDLRFGEKTYLEDGIMYVSKDEIIAFAKEEKCVLELKVDIVKPGESARIMNVTDVVQPRCKVSGGIDWPGVLSEDYEIAGSGVTRCVSGMGIVLCQNNTYWSRKWGSFDMSGPFAEYTPYANMPELIIEPITENADFRELREALRRIGYKASVLIAKATLNLEPDKVEEFNNEAMTEGLPNIAYAYQIYSKQYDTENYREPMFYGNAVPDTLPLIIQPTEVLDGAISSCGGYRLMPTYEIQNHPVILELMRAHGKELNFVGVIVTVTAVEARLRHLASKMAATMLKEVFHADGVVITKGVGGASTICVGAIASEAEKLGIKAVPIIQVLNAQSNLSTECLIDDLLVDSIVQTGSYYHSLTLPPVEKVYGSKPDAVYLSGNVGVIGGHIPAGGSPANGEVVSLSMKHVGVISQIGNSFGKAVDY